MVDLSRLDDDDLAALAQRADEARQERRQRRSSRWEQRKQEIQRARERGLQEFLRGLSDEELAELVDHDHDAWERHEVLDGRASRAAVGAKIRRKELIEAAEEERERRARSAAISTAAPSTPRIAGIDVRLAGAALLFLLLFAAPRRDDHDDEADR